MADCQVAGELSKKVEVENKMKETDRRWCRKQNFESGKRGSLRMLLK